MLKLLFAFIISWIKASSVSVFVTSIFVAYCELKFSIASVRLFPIATLFPDATIIFFKTGTSLSLSITWYIGSTYKSVLSIGTTIIFLINFVPLTFSACISFEISEFCSICVSNCIVPTTLLSSANLYKLNLLFPFSSTVPTKYEDKLCFPSNVYGKTSPSSSLLESIVLTIV